MAHVIMRECDNSKMQGRTDTYENVKSTCIKESKKVTPNFIANVEKEKVYNDAVMIIYGEKDNASKETLAHAKQTWKIMARINKNEKVLNQIIWRKRDFNITKAESTNERKVAEEKT